MAFELDEDTQAKVKAVREFLRDYTRLRYTVLTTLAIIGLALWWNLTEQLRGARGRYVNEKAKQSVLEEITQMDKFRRECEEYLPAAEGIDLPWWMDQLTNTGKKQGLIVDRVLPNVPGTRLGIYPQVQFRVDTVGSYAGLCRYVTFLENIKPLVRIQRIEFEEINVREIVLSVDFLPNERHGLIELDALLSPHALD